MESRCENSVETVKQQHSLNETQLAANKMADEQLKYAEAELAATEAELNDLNNDKEVHENETWVYFWGENENNFHGR